jgi:hypothetical protein
MNVTRLWSSLLVSTVLVAACSKSTLAPEPSPDPDVSPSSDEGPDAGWWPPPDEFSRRDCARSSLGKGWLLPPQTGCRSDADCRVWEWGSCIGEPAKLCTYPTGPGKPEDTCERDSDCDAAAGGFCPKVLVATACAYDECRTDSECGVKGACLCSDEHSGGDRYCVEEGCHGDADCGAGQRCRVDESVSGLPPQWHCTTASDTCKERADCAGGLWCGFDKEQHHWLCREAEHLATP